jgi:soluble lytic murein transglycosylase-like protein
MQPIPRMRRSDIYRTVRRATLLLALSGGPARAALYVYQAPDGSRLVTDRVMGGGYVLIYRSASAANVGAVAARRLPVPVRVLPSRYDRLIQRTASRHRVDPALVKAMVHVESAFNPLAISRKGAAGLMQLMPATAQRYGIDNIFDPAQNLEAGTRHLRHLLGIYNQDKRLALAAYNAGQEAVERYRGVPPFSETRRYVHKVLLLNNRYTSKYR